MTKTKSVIERDRDAVLADLGLNNLSEKEKDDVGEALLQHFEKVIIETTIVNLDDQELARFKSALGNENEGIMEERIVSLAAGVPGLAGKIEDALSREFATIKTAYDAAEQNH